MKIWIFVALTWVVAGCANSPGAHAPPTVSDAAADAGARDEIAATDSPKEAGPPAVEAGPQCCTVTLSGPGNGDCPCAPYQTIDRTCSDVGRECQYDGCNGVVSCHCALPEDGGPPGWACAVLLN